MTAILSLVVLIAFLGLAIAACDDDRWGGP